MESLMEPGPREGGGAAAAQSGFGAQGIWWGKGPSGGRKVEPPAYDYVWGAAVPQGP